MNSEHSPALAASGLGSSPSFFRSAVLRAFADMTRGHLRIAADSAHHVVPIMAALRGRAEGLTFALAIDNSAVVLDRLLRHEADVAVMARSVSDPRLHSVRLRSDRVVLFAPRAHPLARRGRAPLSALADQSNDKGIGADVARQHAQKCRLSHA